MRRKLPTQKQTTKNKNRQGRRKSQFNQPLAIVTDYEDNFYIADRDKRLVRKLTIE